MVLGSYRLERTLEAGALFREGVSPRIFLLRAPDVANRGVLDKLRIHVPTWIDIQKEALAQMSVPAAAVIGLPRVTDTTATEAQLVGNAGLAGATPLWQWIGEGSATVFSY